MSHGCGRIGDFYYRLAHHVDRGTTTLVDSTLAKQVACVLFDGFAPSAQAVFVLVWSMPDFSGPVHGLFKLARYLYYF